MINEAKDFSVPINANYNYQVYLNRMRSLELAVEVFKHSDMANGESDIILVADKFYKYITNGYLGTERKE